MHNLDGCDVPDCVMCEWVTWRVIAGVHDLIDALVVDAPIIEYKRWLPVDE
jgi:hypothetical protein